MIYLKLITTIIYHNYLLNINVYRYAQSNRKNQDIKPFAEEIHNLQEMFTTQVYKFLQPTFTSWIQTLEDLYLKTIPRAYGWEISLN